MESLTGKISKRTVDAFTAPAEGRAHFWDTGVKGFFLRAYPGGRKVYALKYRLGRLQRTYTIGTHGSPWTPEKARAEAIGALERVRTGEDPASKRKAAREALTVDELIDAYLTEGPATKPAKRASTWAIDGSNLKRHIRPLLGRKIANVVTKAEAAKAIRDVSIGKTALDERTGPRGRARVTGGEGTARRTRTTAAAMFTWGVDHGLIEVNPFAGLKLTAAPVRERFLSRAEAGALLDAIAVLQSEKNLSSTFADAVRLLLLTGARKTEVLGLKWAEVDIERRRLSLPPERTKAGGTTGARRIILSPLAMALLDTRRDAVNEGRHTAMAANETFIEPEYVFPASRGGGHAIGLRRAFAKTCAKAALPGVRVHDLRHSFASFAVADGASLYLVGKLLGHASARTTERYAHLSGDPLHDAAAMVGQRIMSYRDVAAMPTELSATRLPHLASVP